MGYETWGGAVVLSLQNAWIKFVSYLPDVLGALVVLIVGIFVASTLGKLAKKLFGYTKTNVSDI